MILLGMALTRSRISCEAFNPTLIKQERTLRFRRRSGSVTKSNGRFVIYLDGLALAEGRHSVEKFSIATIQSRNGPQAAVGVGSNFQLLVEVAAGLLADGSVDFGRRSTPRTVCPTAALAVGQKPSRCWTSWGPRSGETPILV